MNEYILKGIMGELYKTASNDAGSAAIGAVPVVGGVLDATLDRSGNPENRNRRAVLQGAGSVLGTGVGAVMGAKMAKTVKGKVGAALAGAAILSSAGTLAGKKMSGE